MTTIDLASVPWTVCGWRPWAWRLRRSMETGAFFPPDIPAVPMAVPGSVQGALRAAGMLPDWLTGFGSLACEWVEHRDWEVATEIAAGAILPGEPVELHADGLDHAGFILVDCVPVAEFRGTLIRHRFDLTAQLGDGKAHRLSIVFSAAPDEQGQIGFTSQSHHFKPRFSYSWDWCPRFVTVGVWDGLRLVLGAPRVEVLKARTAITEDMKTGAVHVRLRAPGPARATITLRGPDGAQAASATYELRAGDQDLELAVAAPALWWPNGHGAQPLYDLAVAVGGAEIDRRSVGFKRVRWLHNPGAPDTALPWLCEVNGKAIFLQGVNWTPAQLDWHATTAADYRKLIELYVGLGCNVLRVWGGAYLERTAFYDLCDRAGLFVWQEFPLSSSGIDNYAPENPAAIVQLCAIAKDYIARRGHHACKLLWCGGNELQEEKRGAKKGDGVPLDLSHPCLAALADVVAAHDPGTRFIPCSPSGPTFSPGESAYGKGIVHHVHGPWNHKGPWADWERYWARDEATLRSETGMPGASSAAVIRKYRGDAQAWPPVRDNRYWLHSSAWWLQWDEFRAEVEPLSPEAGLDRYCALSQERQARALTIAAGASKARFPGCGGFIVWMGHDCFPCGANTSLIDVDGGIKPAYTAVQKIFTS
jgi:beta-mannosidase